MSDAEPCGASVRKVSFFGQWNHFMFPPPIFVKPLGVIHKCDKWLVYISPLFIFIHHHIYLPHSYPAPIGTTASDFDVLLVVGMPSKALTYAYQPHVRIPYLSPLLQISALCLYLPEMLFEWGDLWWERVCGVGGRGLFFFLAKGRVGVTISAVAHL